MSTVSGGGASAVREVDLLVVGGLGLDIAVAVPSVPPPDADSTTVPPIDLRVGNTGAGVALAAAALGLRVLVVDTLGADPAGEIVRAALHRAGVAHRLVDDPRGTRRSVSLIDPAGRRSSLYDPRGGWAGPPPFAGWELAQLAAAARHVHVSIMDWVAPLVPDLAGSARSSSTDLHDWDGENPYHRAFLPAADIVFVSGTELGDRLDATLRAVLDGARQAAPPARPAVSEVTSALPGAYPPTADGGSATSPAGGPSPADVEPQRGGPAFSGVGRRRGGPAFEDGRLPLAVGTLGERGARVMPGDAVPFDVPAAAPPAAIVDSNGAGDAFAAGFIAARLRGERVDRAAGYAARVAVASCTVAGMEYPPGLLPAPGG
ncbi:PfkB family carbohydrate kinase [Rhizomonospora bruguierae]|uniref:PfkB family carbohydrate kinase n=1 Tax=Rhizomonospora bruguierae TaxID=1581705 RepID=UPI001BCD850E|nr:carbohydrate kinase family protein [Micromonospora sp. NBRC 107566]